MNRHSTRIRTAGPGLALVLLLTLFAGTVPAGPAATGIMSAQSGGPILNPSHPDRYVVQRGDTLWDISSMFLRDPWFWPEIWYANPQIANPHLIFPGDVLTLVYVDGMPRLQLQRGETAQTASGTEKLSPRIREEALDSAIPAVPFEDIAAFLTQGGVLERGEADAMPYVVAIRDDLLAASAGNDVYVRGDMDPEKTGYNVIHVGEELRDPDDGAVLGYESIMVGAGTIRRGGDPATLTLNTTNREVLRGDKLVPQEVEIPLYFQPHAPEGEVNGRIISVVDGVSRIGQYQVVILNRGSKHGLEPGHILTVWQTGPTVRDEFTDGLMPSRVQLPDERAGTLMIFRSYDRVSYALITEATSEIRVLDQVKSPG